MKILLQGLLYLRRGESGTGSFRLLVGRENADAKEACVPAISVQSIFSQKSPYNDETRCIIVRIRNLRNAGFSVITR
jgi:hypothetical protein